MRDVVVIGGGPAGSTAANLLARKGYSVLLVEREQFPRFQIGESLLPYNNDLFQRLGVLDDLRRKQSTFPKFGAEFVTADEGVSFTFRFGENLPPQYGSALQVRRAEFDEFLLRQAGSAGVEVRERTSALDVDISDPERAIVRIAGSDGAAETVEARFVIDASGHGTVLGRKIGGRREEESLRKVAIFAHYRGMTGRCTGKDAGNTVIVLLEDAWLWVIPLSEEVTSVGLVLDRDVVKNSRLAPERLLEMMIRETPYLARRMGEAERVSQVYTRKDFSYTVDKVSGPNYCLVGDAAGFFDPIFSTGVFMAMKTAAVAADAIDERLRRGTMKELHAYRRSLHSALRRYFAFIRRFYQREFLEVFLQPAPRFGLFRVVVGVLAGDVFESRRDRWRLALFFLLTSIQRLRPVIAPRIAWDTLPRVGGMVTSEESLV